MRIIKYHTNGSTEITGRAVSNISESVSFSDNRSKVYDKLINDGLSKLEIQPLLEFSKFWNTLSTLIKDNMTRQLMLANSLNLVYDADQADDIMLDHIANIYGIKFPNNYTNGQKTLLLKYFPNFLKYKGIPQYALRILELIDRDEGDLYNNPSVGQTYSIQPMSNGVYALTLPTRIVSVDFAYEIVNRLTPEGMYYGSPNQISGSITDSNYIDDTPAAEFFALLYDDEPEFGIG